MHSLIRILIIVILAAIIVSLGSGLFYLSRGARNPEEQSRKLARALTVRIVLSIALFVLLMIAWRMGLISPHGLQMQAAGPVPGGP